jgi:hypothetical protein
MEARQNNPISTPLMARWLHRPLPGLGSDNNPEPDQTPPFPAFVPGAFLRMKIKISKTKTET